MCRNIINNGGICCIFNFAAHYREPIYKLMNQELQCDFFIGDKVPTQITQMNYKDLSGFKKNIKNKYIFSKFYWQKGAISLCFKPYKHYIITGDPFCLSTWLLLIMLKFTSKRTYLWTHGWYGDEGFIKSSIKKIYFNLSSHILLYGEYAKKLMTKKGFKESKLSIIYNSLDYSRQLNIRKNLKETPIYTEHFKNNYPTLIYIGRIQAIKKLDQLINSLELLEEKGKKYNLIIVGEEVDGYNLSELNLTSKVSNRIWLYGPCYDEEKIGELLYNAEICISPGNVGLTAIHSLSYGTSIITHDNFSNQMPEFEAVINNRTGLFFIENDVEDLSNKIDTWHNYLNTNKTTVRSDAFQTIDNKYNPNNQIQLLKSLINN